jgi:hypothetical protein
MRVNKSSHSRLISSFFHRQVATTLHHTFAATMNAGTMETDAKPIKLEEEEPEEGEIVQSDVKTSQQWLVVHSPSSSLPSSVDDSSVLRFLDAQPVTDADSTVASLRGKCDIYVQLRGYH